jgi:hypothetical protein
MAARRGGQDDLIVRSFYMRLKRRLACGRATQRRHATDKYAFTTDNITLEMRKAAAVTNGLDYFG